MNKTRLQAVRDRLRSLDPSTGSDPDLQRHKLDFTEEDELTNNTHQLDPVDTLDMSIYHAGDGGCRTLGCIAGLTITMYPGEALTYADDADAEDGIRPRPQDIAQHLLGLDDRQGARLFFADNDMDLRAITPEQAATAVDNVLAGKNPHSLWDHVPRP